jgi:fucose permease
LTRPDPAGGAHPGGSGAPGAAGGTAAGGDDDAGAAAGVFTWPRLVLAFGGFILLGLGAGAGGVLIPSQMADYGIDKVTVGLMFFGFSGGYLASSLSTGALVARLGVRAQLALGAAIYVVASVGIGLRPPFGLLLLLTVVSGAGCGVVDAGFNAYISTLPGHTALLNYMHAFFGVGALAGPLLASRMLVAGLPWQDVYLVLAAAGVPILLGCATLPRRVRVPHPAGGPPERHGAPLARALRRRGVWYGAVFLCLYVGAEVSVGNWGFSFLTQERGQGPLLAGSVVSVYWCGLTLGRFVINTVASRAGLGASTMLFGCLGGMAVATLLAWWGPGPVLAILGFGLLGFFLGPIFPTTVAVMPRLTPARLVPSAIGFLVGMSVVGGAVFPYVAGALAQGIGIASLMPYLLVLAVLQAGAWWLITARMRPAGQSGGSGTAPAELADGAAFSG